MASTCDIRAGDVIYDAEDRDYAYRVDALDQPSIGWLTVIRFDPFDPLHSQQAEEWITAHALALVAHGRFIVGARQVSLPHIDSKPGRAA